MFAFFSAVLFLKLREQMQSAPATRDDSRNVVLRQLSDDEYQRIVGSAEWVFLASKQGVWESGDDIRHVFFPETAVISLVTLLEAGSIEAITIGKDGFVGLPVYHGPGSTITRAVCQMPGFAWRMSVEAFARVCSDSPGLRSALDRYSQFVIETISQSAACNRVHVIEERCARWLLMSHDRVGSDEIPLTQEFLAQMLGVRRPGVTVAIGILKRAGFIGHSRGLITVTDRPGLERASCECYRAIRSREKILSLPRQTFVEAQA
jgi:CRP-like cAMP-binding protein